MTANKNYTTHLNCYSEAAALQQLLQAATAMLEAENQRIESDSDDAYQEQFTITVAGIQTAFIAGAPQYEALMQFIQHIAAENFYAVDFDKATVTE